MKYVYGLSIQGKTSKGNKDCFWHEGTFETKEKAIEKAKELKSKRIMISKYKENDRYYALENEIIQIKDPK